VFGSYRRADTSGATNAYGIQALTIRDGLIADITTFRVPGLFPHFWLPVTLHVATEQS
jgi:hypothetical protein